MVCRLFQIHNYSKCMYFTYSLGLLYNLGQSQSYNKFHLTVICGIDAFVNLLEKLRYSRLTFRFIDCIGLHIVPHENMIAIDQMHLRAAVGYGGFVPLQPHM